MKTTTLVLIGLALAGGVYLYEKEKAASQPSEGDIMATYNYALKNETNPSTLRTLAQKLRAAGYPNEADALDAKATSLEAWKGSTPMSAPIHPAAAATIAASNPSSPLAQSALQTVAMVLGQPGLHAPRYLIGSQPLGAAATSATP